MDFADRKRAWAELQDFLAVELDAEQFQRLLRRIDVPLTAWIQDRYPRATMAMDAMPPRKALTLQAELGAAFSRGDYPPAVNREIEAFARKHLGLAATDHLRTDVVEWLRGKYTAGGKPMSRQNEPGSIAECQNHLNDPNVTRQNLRAADRHIRGQILRGRPRQR